MKRSYLITVLAVCLLILSSCAGKASDKPQEAEFTFGNTDDAVSTTIIYPFQGLTEGMEYIVMLEVVDEFGAALKAPDGSALLSEQSFNPKTSDGELQIIVSVQKAYLKNPDNPLRCRAHLLPATDDEE